MAPFATYLITNFDWHTAYLIIGLIAWLTVLPLAMLLKKDPREVGSLPDGVKPHAVKIRSEESGIQLIDSPLSLIFRTRSFWLLLFLWFLFAACLFFIFTHLVAHITDMGFSAGQAAVILSLIGLAAIPGRLLMGIASDRLGRKLAVIICTLLLAGSIAWLVWARDLWSLYLFALVFGFSQSGFGSSGAVLVSDTFGLGKIGAIFGLLEIGFGIGAALGPAIGGIIFDINQSYSIAFLLGTVAMLIATLLVALIRRETNINFTGGQGR
jgi:predicted MFS family arabinose efflux permease